MDTEKVIRSYHFILNRLLNTSISAEPQKDELESFQRALTEAEYINFDTQTNIYNRFPNLKSEIEELSKNSSYIRSYEHPNIRAPELGWIRKSLLDRTQTKLKEKIGRSLPQAVPKINYQKDADNYEREMYATYRSTPDQIKANITKKYGNELQKLVAVFDLDGTLTNEPQPNDKDIESTKPRISVIAILKELCNKGATIVISSAWNNFDGTLARAAKVLPTDIFNRLTQDKPKQAFRNGNIYTYTKIPTGRYYRHKAFAALDITEKLQNKNDYNYILIDDSKDNIDIFNEDMRTQGIQNYRAYYIELSRESKFKLFNTTEIYQDDRERIAEKQKYDTSTLLHHLRENLNDLQYAQMPFPGVKAVQIAKKDLLSYPVQDILTLARYYSIDEGQTLNDICWLIAFHIMKNL